jgi:hypothetical protein
MTKNRSIKTSLGLIAVLTSLALPAYATTYTATGTVSTINIKDNSNNGGSNKFVEIDFTAPITQCTGTTSTTLVIQLTESTFFDAWVKLAETAKLSGKQLRVGTSNASGSCKTYYMRLEP